MGPLLRRQIIAIDRVYDEAAIVDLHVELPVRSPRISKLQVTTTSQLCHLRLGEESEAIDNVAEAIRAAGEQRGPESVEFHADGES
ncbi:hypothetical protein FRB97_006700 [Tulasnella sp. 331]|nr:hypothetical protein FRB97_006700 [Tulasnella sp. 331]